MGQALQINATVRIGPILAAFARLRPKDFRAVFKKLRKPMNKDQTEHRDQQRGPRGPWAPLAASTKARYAREGKRRNRRILARLPNPRQSILSAEALIIRSRVRWSMAHQVGPTRVGRGSILPQRQFLWISKSLLKVARREFSRALWSRWRGRPV